MLNKNFLFIIFFTPISCLNAQKKHIKIIKNEIETIVYDEHLKQPIDVKYQVLCNNKSKEHFNRKGLDFYEEQDYITSTNEDYKNNIYDKGHMIPAMEVSCNQEYLQQSFSFLNCALQHQDLNRGVWEHLEKHEKYLALNNAVYVHIKIIFDSLIKIRPNNLESAYIPTGFFKTICLNDTTSLSTCKTYFFPNKKPISNDIEDYRVENTAKERVFNACFKDTALDIIKVFKEIIIQRKIKKTKQHTKKHQK